jgi:hypothetical protein
MTIKIIPNDKGNPPGKLADVELHFTSGPLDGLKLIGFGVWERRTGAGRNVTFLARQYSVPASADRSRCCDHLFPLPTGIGLQSKRPGRRQVRDD